MTVRIRPTAAAALLAATALSGTFPLAVQAQDTATTDLFFERLATFPVYLNAPEGADPAAPTAAEIIAATPDGRMLVYTDSPGGRIGMIDIADPAQPIAAGTVAMAGEPTSVAISGGLALVGVNTSESFVAPSGHLAVVDIETREILATCDVGGQPDSVALSPDGTFLAIAVENERDEEFEDGAIPQLPSGHLAVFDMSGDQPANCDAVRIVDLTGLAEIAPDDAEPEYVDINADNVAVVTLQENNHLVLVDLASGAVTAHFSAGTVTLEGVDTVTDGIIAATGTLTDIRREPDTVQWIGTDRFVTADEGDYQGGSRGFTIFSTDGTVVYEAGTSFEYLAMEIGHYPEKRARAKGTEPEGAEVASFGDDTLIFIGSERGSFTAVYRDTGGDPELVQILPGGVGPEGLLAISSRDLFVVAAEQDKPGDGIRSTVTIYGRTATEPAYPTIVSARDAAGVPIGWGALSGLAADRSDDARLWAVADSFYADTRIFSIDVSATPAVIVTAMPVTRDGAQASYDAEGIVERPGGGFWLVSEGNPEREQNKTYSLLIELAADGTVTREIALPETLAAGMTRYGFEGVTVTGEGEAERVWIAIQREWADDPAGQVKLAVWTPSTEEWGFVAYPLETAERGWVGLSEITTLDDDTLLVLERDNQGGPDAALKAVYRIDISGVEPVPHGAVLPVLEKRQAIDLLPHLQAPNGWVADKPEGFAIAGDGQIYAVTDNDGVDGATGGETLFLRLGTVDTLD